MVPAPNGWMDGWMDEWMDGGWTQLEHLTQVLEEVLRLAGSTKSNHAPTVFINIIRLRRLLRFRVQLEWNTANYNLFGKSLNLSNLWIWLICQCLPKPMWINISRDCVCEPYRYGDFVHFLINPGRFVCLHKTLAAGQVSSTSRLTMMQNSSAQGVSTRL